MRNLLIFALAALSCAAQTWNQNQKLAASDPGASANFGISVAMDGNTAVSANGKGSGEAYVFVRSSPSSAWTLQQVLPTQGNCTVNSGQCPVAVNGDTIAIGASGAVFVWVRNGTTWTLQQELTASDGAGGDLFGSAVALEGDTVIAGAQGHQNFHGAAYAFARSGALWTQQAEFFPPPNPAGNQEFGESVSVSGNTAVIGGNGEAVIFVRSGTSWTQQQQIGGGPGNDTVPGHVAVSGDTLAYGEYGGFDNGSVFVYTRTGSTWNIQQTLHAPDYPAGGFGSVLALAGNTLVVGAPTRPYPVTQPNQAQGSAYVFTRSGATWTVQQELGAADGAPFDKFGYSVALSGNTILAGAPFKNVSFVGDGAAYSFLLNPSVSLAAVSVTPSMGVGASPMFLPLYTDPSGASDLQVVYFDIGSSLFAHNSCIVLYIQAQNALYLYNDTNSAIQGPVGPQSSTTVSNSQCTLGGSGAVVKGGTNLEIPIALNFANSFQSTKSMWGLAQSYSGAQSGWTLLGSWTPFPGPALAAVSLTPTNGGGTGPQTFRATYADPNGFNDLQVAYLDFGQTIFGANSCIVSYVQASNQLFLYNDAGTGRVAGSITEGSNGTLSNSQCTVSGSGGTVSGSGFNLTVPVNLTFSSTFRGTQNVWGLAQSYSGMQSPWNSFGTWVTGLGTVSVNPNSGSGFGPQTFRATYIDPNGPTDIQVVYLDFGTSIFAAGSCIVAYVPSNSGIYLFNDASSGTVAGSPITAGTSSSLSNSQCTVSGSGGTVATSGFTLTMPFSITFSGTFLGSKNVWGLVQSYSGAQSGWQIVGTWTP